MRCFAGPSNGECAQVIGGSNANSWQQCATTLASLWHAALLSPVGRPRMNRLAPFATMLVKAALAALLYAPEPDNLDRICV